MGLNPVCHSVLGACDPLLLKSRDGDDMLPVTKDEGKRGLVGMERCVFF